MFPKVSFSDVWTPRLGAEYRGTFASHFTWAARAGYAYEPSPVPPQTGLTSFADNDRHIVTLGAGVASDRLWSWLPKRLSLDAALQVHELVGKTTVKGTPSPGFSSGGSLIHLGVTLEARY
jgi:long-chain fatty acid transport protein